MSDHTTISNINNRTAGSGGYAKSSGTVQSWKNKSFDAVQTEEQASRTAARAIVMDKESFFKTASKTSNPEKKRESFETALTMAEEKPAEENLSSSVFGFEDVLDVINPLQHLPVVNLVYRGLTGDTIKPMAQIIGGGLYGGPVGAISGTVNAVIEHETGHDIAGNVLALVRGENGSENESIEFARAKDNPEKQLEIAAGYFEDSAREIAAKRELPGTAMAFVNLKKTAISYDKRAAAGGRTAGYMNVRRPSDPAPVSYTPAPITPETLPHRDPVTRMELSPLPPETGF